MSHNSFFKHHNMTTEFQYNPKQLLSQTLAESYKKYDPSIITLTGKITQVKARMKTNLNSQCHFKEHFSAT